MLFDPSGAVLSSLTVPDPSPDYLYDEAAETPVLALAWHPHGTHLAVLPRGQSFAMVWSAEGGTARVDGGVKVRFVRCPGLPADEVLLHRQPCPASTPPALLPRVTPLPAASRGDGAGVVPLGAPAGAGHGQGQRRGLRLPHVSRCSLWPAHCPALPPARVAQKYA